MGVTRTSGLNHLLVVHRFGVITVSSVVETKFPRHLDGVGVGRDGIPDVHLVSSLVLKGSPDGNLQTETDENKGQMT